MELITIFEEIKLESMNYRTKKILVIMLDVILWAALVFFGFKYFTGC